MKRDCLLVSDPINFKGVFGMTHGGREVKSVVIPIVQRDYAQGRISPEVNRIRQRFLQVLYDALAGGKKTTLDFIYGYVGEQGELIPLDGQQRLTTLFLLHYYIAAHEKVEEKERDFLKNFTYMTRVDSREFCRHLLLFTPDFSKERFSEQVRDEAWFLLEWEHDPTVQSMLVMLDAIHDKFKTTSGLWPNLMGDNISFYFLPLSQMGVADEIYIKMNSRGKALTRFEHFKAELELKMKEVNIELAKQVMRKIDREWTDLLWPFRDSGTGNQQADAVIDDEFLRYMHFISDIIGFRNGSPMLTDEFDIIEKQFSYDCPAAEQNIRLMETLFDIWNKDDTKDIDAFFDKFISEKDYQPGKILIDSPKNLFRECCKSYGVSAGNNRFAFSLVQTILLYSFTLYLRNKETVSESVFRRRLRIVSNLAKNSPFFLRFENMRVLLSLVDGIILHGVIGEGEGTARFQPRQTEEEIAKLQWTNAKPEMAETLFRLEDHPYLNGFISSVGLDHVEWCDRFYSLFRQDLNKVNRAMLAIGDCFVKDNWRFQIGTADNRLALGVWRGILGPVKLQDNLCRVLQTLLSKSETFSEKVLDGVIWHYLQTEREMSVRYYLVKYPQMLPNRYGKYYWRKHWENGRNSYHVIMMITEISVSNGYNYDIFLKTLYEIAGGENVGLELGNYSYSMYNNEGLDKLYLNDRQMYLTLNENVYTMWNANGEIIETCAIPQNEKGIDTDDRIQIGLRMLNNQLHIYTEEKVKSYIERCEWRFAKTMPQWPHCYIVRGNCSLEDDEFVNFVWSQRVLGSYDVWGNYRQPYLHIDGYKYWTMGCEIENTTVINRALE